MIEKRKHILVVEDETELAELVRERLEHNNYRISVAENGEKAIDMIGRETFDLIILDIILPVVDGYEVCRRIKLHPTHAGVPVLMFTAKGEEASQDKAFAAGADAYIVKPYEADILLYKIKHLLEDK